MPYAVSLCLDAASARRIEAMWQVLDKRGLSDHMLRLQYRPHLTLGLWDELDVEAVTPHLTAFAATLAPIPCSVAALANFPGESGVLWAVPIVTEALLTAHARLHAALGLPPHPRYRVGDWVPHCTLGMQLSPRKAAAALKALSAEWEPFAAQLELLDLVHFNPVEILWQQTLAVRSSSEAYRPH